jgi:hypothetical protein
VFHFSNRFLSHKLLEREHVVSWTTDMVENSTMDQSPGLFVAQLHVTASVFPHNKPACLSVWLVE